MRQPVSEIAPKEPHLLVLSTLTMGLLQQSVSSEHKKAEVTESPVEVTERPASVLGTWSS
jgi:hypothetical protein